MASNAMYWFDNLGQKFHYKEHKVQSSVITKHKQYGDQKILKNKAVC